MSAGPDKNLTRGALLSARLFADALTNPLLRYGGMGTMRIEDALDTLISDGKSRKSRTPWLTRLRLATAIQENAGPAHLGTLKPQLTALAETTYRDDVRAKEAFEYACDNPDHRSTPVAEKPDLSQARNWVTTVQKDGKATVIRAEVEVKASFAKLCHMVDPRRWAENSVFWYKSERIDQEDPEDPPLEPLVDDPPLPPPYWEGLLRETVAGMSLYTTHLNIKYYGRPDGRDTVVEYSLNWTPDNIETDEGSVRIAPVPGDDEWVKGVVTKRVDFTDNPYGGPSTADLIAPSYLGSWLRVQQDLWIARATEQPIAP